MPRKPSAAQLRRDIIEYLGSHEDAAFVARTEERLARSAQLGGGFVEEDGAHSPQLYDDAQRAAQIRLDLAAKRRARARETRKPRSRAAR